VYISSDFFKKIIKYFLKNKKRRGVVGREEENVPS
jgi:hypothetical protein